MKNVADSKVENLIGKMILTNYKKCQYFSDQYFVLHGTKSKSLLSTLDGTA